MLSAVATDDGFELPSLRRVVAEPSVCESYHQLLLTCL